MKVLVTLILTLAITNAFGIGGKGPLEYKKDGVKNKVNPVLKEIGIDENLGEKVDLSLPFKDELGNDVVLGNYFNDKPVLMVLIYYECPTLCSLHLNSLMDTFKNFDWGIGDKFEFVAVSIDPNEKPDLAKEKLENYVKEYGRPETRDGWHFLTGTEASIKKLAGQIGFRYAWNPREKQWAHSAASYVLTPQGDISFYHYGISIEPKVLRLSLVEAADNKIGSLMDKVLLFCLQYDPDKKTYAFYALNIVRVGGVLTLLVLALFLFNFWRKETQKTQVN